MKFTVNKEAFEYALNNSYFGCHDAEHAAYGRAAEIMITHFAAKEHQVSILTLQGVKRYSKPTIGITDKIMSPVVFESPMFTEEFRHDGLIFNLWDVSVFKGPFEAKLQILNNRVFLSERERELYAICRKKSVQYNIALARLLSKNTLECEYLAMREANDETVNAETGEILTSRFRK